MNTYEKAVRGAAINGLITTKNMSGKLRRQLLRATGVPVAIAKSEPKDEGTRLAARFSRAPIASLGKWHRRVTCRMATVQRGLEAAIGAGLTRAVDALQIRKDRFTLIESQLRLEITNRGAQFQFPEKL